MNPWHLSLLSGAVDACLLMIHPKRRTCSQAKCGLSLKCRGHLEYKGVSVKKTEWTWVMFSGLAVK